MLSQRSQTARSSSDAPQRCRPLFQRCLTWRSDGGSNTALTIHSGARGLFAASSRFCVYRGTASAPAPITLTDQRRQFLPVLRSTLERPINGRSIGIKQQQRVQPARFCLGSLDAVTRNSSITSETSGTNSPNRLEGTTSGVDQTMQNGEVPITRPRAMHGAFLCTRSGVDARRNVFFGSG